MQIRQLQEPAEKQQITRRILEALPEWFEVESSREQYIAECVGQPFFAAFDGNEPVGFLCLKQTGNATVELAVMGVLKSHHRQGVGRALFDAKDSASCRSRPSKWACTPIMTRQTGSISASDSASWKCCRSGMRQIRARSIL